VSFEEKLVKARRRRAPGSGRPFPKNQGTAASNSWRLRGGQSAADAQSPKRSLRMAAGYATLEEY
jgi:hypothetical protein